MTTSHDKVFRLMSHSEVETAESTGFVPLVEVDRKDGYIHMSPHDQVLVTAALYFDPGSVLYALELSAEALGEDLKWERVEARGQVLFPHYYQGLLPWRKASRLHTIEWSEDGTPAWSAVRALDS